MSASHEDSSDSDCDVVKVTVRIPVSRSSTLKKKMQGRSRDEAMMISGDGEEEYEVRLTLTFVGDDKVDAEDAVQRANRQLKVRGDSRWADELVLEDSESGLAFPLSSVPEETWGQLRKSRSIDEDLELCARLWSAQEQTLKHYESITKGSASSTDTVRPI